jgi:REP element-mobilizing transposase RayT
MARPLRIEFAGALYHLTARGDRREAIYDDDEDRVAFLDILGAVVGDFNWACYGYCLMTNHYHLVMETPDGNLSKGMRQLNGVYTQYSNRRHKRVGHLFQGRYKAILVDEEAYLLELSRYVVLNPARAGMAQGHDEWPWSSYPAMMGRQPAPDWLRVDALLARFGAGRALARRRYARFVAEGIGADSIWRDLRGQIYLGDERFVQGMQARLDRKAGDDINVPRAQRRGPAPALASIEAACKDRDQAMLAAHDTGQYSYQQIAEHFGIHFTTVGRIVRAGRKARGKPAELPRR